jgi:hypothetical protein
MAVQFGSFGGLLDSIDGGYGGSDGSEFVFARLRYNERLSNYGRSGWRTDWPEADKHFIIAIDRMSNIRVVMDKDIAIDIMDPALFSYPFLYALEVGRGGGMNLTMEEAERLREYMDRGGFIMIDDFWGGQEWSTFAYDLAKIFPDREPEQLPVSHPMFHTFFDIDQIIQVPNIGNGRSVPYGGVTWERYDAQTPYALAVFDDDRRPMMVINFNTDIGDAWEHADDPSYPNEFPSFAFRIGINYIIYAMTH